MRTSSSSGEKYKLPLNPTTSQSASTSRDISHSYPKSFTIRNFPLNNRTDNCNFKPLSELDKFNKDKIDQFNNLPFTGNPAHILINVEGGAEGEEKKEPENKDAEPEDSEEEV